MMVKICGITNLDDAKLALDHGASALGFIFYPGSPRFISPADAARLSAGLNDAIWKVGVFVDARPEIVAETARAAGLDVVQLHGHETPAGYPALPRIWKAWRVNGSQNLDPHDPAEAWLLDGPASGQAFDWSLAAGLPKSVILAGGLDATNVREAIERARPWGVDASSRLESAPGKKDHAKVKAFLRAALA
jgi:phosphoribosylanthranilate isomerase